MYKKLIIIFSLGNLLALVGIIICCCIMLSPNLKNGNQTDFWNKTEGEYEVYYTLEGVDSISESMLKTYLDSIIYVEFQNEDVTIIVTLNVETEKESMLYIDNSGYKECIKEQSDNEQITIYSYTTTSLSFTTDTLTFKVTIGSMPFSPEFSILLSFDTAYLIK